MIGNHSLYNLVGNVSHAAIISKVENGQIYYAGNTEYRFDKLLANTFRNGELGVYIIHMNKSLPATDRDVESYVADALHDGWGAIPLSRIHVEDNFESIAYVNSSLGEVTQVFAQASTYTGESSHLYGLSRLASYEGAQATYYLNDGRGSTTAAIQGSNIIANYSWGAYGELIRGTYTESPFYGYDSEDYSPATNTLYLRARYLNVAEGTFGVEDSYLGSVFIPQSQNLFAYAQGNPIRYIDPSGHSPLDFITDVWNGAKRTGQRVWNAAADFAQRAWNGATTVASNLYNAATSFFSGGSSSQQKTYSSSKSYSYKGKTTGATAYASSAYTYRQQSYSSGLPTYGTYAGTQAYGGIQQPLWIAQQQNYVNRKYCDYAEKLKVENLQDSLSPSNKLEVRNSRNEKNTVDFLRDLAAGLMGIDVFKNVTKVEIYRYMGKLLSSSAISEAEKAEFIEVLNTGKSSLKGLSKFARAAGIAGVFITVGFAGYDGYQRQQEYLEANSGLMPNEQLVSYAGTEFVLGAIESAVGITPQLKNKTHYLLYEQQFFGSTIDATLQELGYKTNQRMQRMNEETGLYAGY